MTHLLPIFRLAEECARYELVDPDIPLFAVPTETYLHVASPLLANRYEYPTGEGLAMPTLVYDDAVKGSHTPQAGDFVQLLPPDNLPPFLNHAAAPKDSRSTSPLSNERVSCSKNLALLAFAR